MSDSVLIIAPFLIYGLFALWCLIKNKILVAVQSYPPESVDAIIYEQILGKKVSRRGIAAGILQLCQEGYLNLHFNDNKLDVLLVNEYNGLGENRMLVDEMFKNNTEVWGQEGSIVVYPVYHLSEKKMRQEFINDMNSTSGYTGFVSRYDKLNAIIWRIVNVIAMGGLLLIGMGRSHSSSITSAAVVMVLFLYVGFKIFDTKMVEKEIVGIVFSVIWTFLLINMFLGSLFTLGKTALIIDIVLCILTGFLVYGKKIDRGFIREKECLAGFFRGLSIFGGSRRQALELSEGDPDRFYEVLPYLCAINRHKGWINLHRQLKPQKPEWLIGEEDFNMDTLAKCIDELYML